MTPTRTCVLTNIPWTSFLARRFDKTSAQIRHGASSGGLRQNAFVGHPKHVGDEEWRKYKVLPHACTHTPQTLNVPIVERAIHCLCLISWWGFLVRGWVGVFVSRFPEAPCESAARLAASCVAFPARGFAEKEAQLRKSQSSPVRSMTGRSQLTYPGKRVTGLDVRPELREPRSAEKMPVSQACCTGGKNPSEPVRKLSSHRVTKGCCACATLAVETFGLLSTACGCSLRVPLPFL